MLATACPRVAAAAVIAALALTTAQTASAGVLEAEIDGVGHKTLRYIASDDDRDELDVTSEARSAEYWIFFRAAGERIALGASASAAGCEERWNLFERYVRCTADDRTLVEAQLGPGNDSATNTSAIAARFFGGAGDDTLSLQSSPDGPDVTETLDGGPGDDQLTGGRRRDVLRGGPGEDQLYAGGPGVADLQADDFSGGDGRDSMHYEVYPGWFPVHVSLDDTANDGHRYPGTGGQSDNDFVRPDIEVVHGTNASDHLTGGAGDDALYGYSGDDTLIGGGGSDFLDGGWNNDTIDAHDHLLDRVDCGESDGDRVVGDLMLDVVFFCEIQDLKAPDVDGDGHDGGPTGHDCNDLDPSIHPLAPVIFDNDVDENCDGVIEIDPDRDDDGVHRPLDCNDADAAIKPGAPAILDNDVDENCDGVIEIDLDRDDDGAHRPLDCDDANAAIKPGALERRDNAHDDNCDGVVEIDRDGDSVLAPRDCRDDDPAIHPGARETVGNSVDEDCLDGPQPFPRVRASVGGEWDYDPFRLWRLVVADVQAGSRITVSCSGRGCPLRSKTTVVTRPARRLSVIGALRMVPLSRGTVIEVRVTLAGHDGILRRYTVRGSDRRPRIVNHCVPAGGSQTRACV